MRNLYPFLMVLLFAGVSHAQYAVNGTAFQQSSTSAATYFQLTPGDFYKRGSVFSNTPVNLTQDFEVNAKLYFGTADAGADGIAFVLQNSGTTYLGREGAGIGYHRFNGTHPSDIPADVPGPVPSFIIEFDTWQNELIGNQNVGDPAADHVGFMSNSNAYHSSSTTLQAAQVLSANIEDGQWHDVKFNWNASQKKMTVSFTTTNSPVVTQTFSYTGDIVNSIFGGSASVYWGFTAGTGSFNPNIHGVGIINAASCGQLRTQTPGGWGASPNGNNPGRYLHDHFGSAFPNGLRVGLQPDFHVLFTSAQAITDYMPAGGPSKKLTANYTNPATTTLKNTLVDHLVALTLSVGFDDADPSFGQAGITLGDMKIGSGAFANWTVRNFLSEANIVLGGGTSIYTIQQVLETASAINENYVDGSQDHNYLDCPGGGGTAGRPALENLSQEVTTKQSFIVGPNPTNGLVDLRMNGVTGKADVIITSANGSVVERRSISNTNTVQRFNLDQQPSGLYLMRIITDQGIQVHKLVVQR